MAGFLWLLLALVMVARFPSGFFADLFIVVYFPLVRCYPAALPWLVVCSRVLVVGTSYGRVIFIQLG